VGVKRFVGSASLSAELHHAIAQTSATISGRFLIASDLVSISVPILDFESWSFVF
jgi:hypothetical protein